MIKRKIKSKRLQEEFEFVKKAKEFFGITSSKPEVIKSNEPVKASEPPPLSSKDIEEIRKKVSVVIGTECIYLRLYNIPLIYYNFYGLHKFNHLYYRDSLGNRQKGSHYFLDRVNYHLEKYSENKNLLDISLNEQVKSVMSFIISDISKLIDENIIDLKEDVDTEKLLSLIKQHGKHKDKIRDLVYYNKKLIFLEDPKGERHKEQLSFLNKLNESRNNESYLKYLFEQEEETPKPSPAPVSTPKETIDNEDIEALDQELNTPESQSVDMASSSSMDMMTVLENISNWKDEFEASPILDSFIAGSDIVENDTERSNYQYVSKEQYSAFVSLIDNSREIATLINNLSFDAKKLMGEIELSRKMMISNEE